MKHPVAATSRRRELHLLQHGAAEQAVGIGKRLHDLEVVAALHHRDRHRLADSFHRRGEVAALALEVGRLERAVGDDDRRAQLVDVALRGRSARRDGRAIRTFRDARSSALR